MYAGWGGHSRPVCQHTHGRFKAIKQERDWGVLLVQPRAGTCSNRASPRSDLGPFVNIHMDDPKQSNKNDATRSAK